jgi:hypothetical protein
MLTLEAESWRHHCRISVPSIDLRQNRWSGFAEISIVFIPDLDTNGGPDEERAIGTQEDFAE